MNRFLCWLAVFLFMCSVPAARAATSAPEGADPGRDIRFGVGGGLSMPVGEGSGSLDNSFQGHAFVRLPIASQAFAARLEFTYAKHDFGSGIFLAPGASDPSGTVRVTAAVANLQLSLRQAGPVRPYVLAGAGLYHFKRDIDAFSGFPAGTDTQLGVDTGAGVTFRLGAVSAYLEIRTDNVFSDDVFFTDFQEQFVPITFGVVF